MEAQTLKATRRTETGTKEARQLRERGLLPGIIYARGEASIPFVVDRHDLEVELLHGQRVLALDLEGQSGSFLIKDVQYDYLGSIPQHIDLVQVQLDERVSVRVGVALRGVPAGVKDGGILEQLTDELEVECLASDIPDEIVGHVSKLGVGESLTVGELDVPEGVTLQKSAEDVVATVRTIAEEVAEPEAEEAGEAEPEVISRGKAEEETPEKS